MPDTFSSHFTFIIHYEIMRKEIQNTAADTKYETEPQKLKQYRMGRKRIKNKSTKKEKHNPHNR